MMKANWAALIIGSALVAAAYLAVSAPPPLAEGHASDGRSISVRSLFEIVAAENAAVRQLYTERIVGHGKATGLKFDEKWRSPEVDAGPLPALFLRETARNLERGKSQLGLFLGSDYPISQANAFDAAQAKVFSRVRADRAPQFFRQADIDREVGMFPDIAVAPACVDCHNRHDASPKHDWQLGDVMGATTWVYPRSSVSLPEALRVLAALRSSIRATYAGYVEKSKTFRAPPEIGERWPADGYFLPSPEAFARAAESATSPDTLNRILTLK
jgi:hypothetical protein